MSITLKDPTTVRLSQSHNPVGCKEESRICFPMTSLGLHSLPVAGSNELNRACLGMSPQIALCRYFPTDCMLIQRTSSPASGFLCRCCGSKKQNKAKQINIALVFGFLIFDVLLGSNWSEVIHYLKKTVLLSDATIH